MDSYPRALLLHPADNVAVALTKLLPGQVELVGEVNSEPTTATEEITQGHKLALRLIAEGENVIKYGVAIGFATSPIAAGAWVHTHNCRSVIDERSHTLDPQTGAPRDTPYH